MTPLLVVLVDGLRHDYVNRQDAPFLWTLHEDGLSGPLREAFAGQLRPVFFAGLLPNRSGVGHLFCYDPGGSPFHLANSVPGLLTRLPRIGPPVKDWVLGRARALESRRGHAASASYAYLAEVPWEYLHLFGFSEHHSPTSPDVYPSPSIFDLLREAGMPWLHVGYPDDDQATESILESFIARWTGRERMVFLHFAEVYWYGHLGPQSRERIAALSRIDRALREVFAAISARSGAPDTIVFGDHGMASVRKVLNLYPTLEQTGLEFGSDYVFFLDSTVARFWFPNAEARAVVREALGRVSDGWVLGEQALERYGLAGAPSRLGELYYVVPGGTVLFPNFFQATAPPKGMHGYVPEVEENWARVIVRGAGARGELPRPVDLADVFPVMAELLDLPVPPACQGCSFLRSGNAD